MSTPGLRERIGAINDVVCAASLLNWDTRTMMPAGGALVRGRQIATLINVARDLLCADATLRALEDAEAQQQQGSDPRMQAEIVAVRRALTLHRRVPAEVVGRRAALKPLATAAWAQARTCRDFSLFATHLREAIAAARDFAAAAGGEHPCDAMIDLHEPGETFASQQVMLASVRQGLEPILCAVQDRRPSAPQPLPGPFPLAAQRQAAVGFAERFGFDFGRGRLDSTQHPFESAFTRDDVRITTRFRDDDPATALFGTFHEVGHGLYEQNINPSFTGSALGTDLATLYPMGGAGSGVHESQSRLFENHIGRSRSFWLRHFGELRQAFPGAFDGLDVEAFYRRITWAGPSRIRTEADEVTYDFHVFCASSWRLP